MRLNVTDDINPKERAHRHRRRQIRFP